MLDVGMLFTSAVYLKTKSASIIYPTRFDNLAAVISTLR